MIRYHGTPMTPVADMIKAFSNRHAMVSYAHPEQMEVCAEICWSTVLDNGAFTAWKNGQPYDFTGYAKWAGKWLKHPCVEWAVIPDVIDGTEDQNDALLHEWPFPKDISVPVWHLHESLDRLQRLMHYPRVALGSSGQFAEIGTHDWWHRMSEAMSVLCDGNGFPKVKIHGLRMLDPGVFSKLPFASADSTNVARNVGMDGRWKGHPYASQSRAVRAHILMDRIDSHATCAFWVESAIGAYQNMELFG
jgi:hypothetical protein